jgi:hypothetical protein
MGEKKKRSDDGEGESPRKKAKKTHDQQPPQPDAKEKVSADKVDLLELCETQRPFAIAIASPLAKSKDASKIFKLIGKGSQNDFLLICGWGLNNFIFVLKTLDE